MADREWDNRTSLITDPPDGQFPPLTPQAEARRAAARATPSGRGPADGPEDRPLSERCISYGAPRTGANYNSYVQIIQSPDTTVLLQEMIHDARVVPMTPQAAPAGAHPAAARRSARALGRRHAGGRDHELLNGFQGSTPNVDLTERYTRVSPDFINWEITVNDPDTWTRPYTFMIRLKKTDALIYEYACHEGNYSMEGILAGARKEEATAARRTAAADSVGEHPFVIEREPDQDGRRSQFRRLVLQIRGRHAAGAARHPGQVDPPAALHDRVIVVAEAARAHSRDAVEHFVAQQLDGVAREKDRDAMALVDRRLCDQKRQRRTSRVFGPCVTWTRMEALCAPFVTRGS